MATELIEFRGRAKGMVAAAVLIVVVATYTAPALLAQLGLTSGYGWSLLRFGHRETHLVNRTGHWVGTTSRYELSGPALVLKGERVVIDYAADPSEGGVSVSLVSLTLPFFLPGERIWSRRVESEARDQVAVEVPAPGFYAVRLSFFSFSGSAEVDWTVR